ncbi:MAG: hypothetical protein IT447_16295 [Phycisphaerales bacterium]|nr:hypothetical protein [Phycisphaerales bacterium]
MNSSNYDPADFLTLPYGKYRGMTPRQVIGIDRQYLTWFVRNCRAKSSLLASIGRLLHEKTSPQSNAGALLLPWKTQPPSSMAERNSGQAGILGGDSDDFRGQP